MATEKDTSETLMNKIIELATQYGNVYTDTKEAHIAAKGYAVGYNHALTEKTKEIKELAGIVKLLLPGIGSIPLENVKVIEQYVEKMDQL
ncbi:hypothetical protein [Pedobacter sp. MC2016-24]|uniref:hypothetical protein n=1 Tax=Pedobacter sp. MC2016-24 TaxID=2780090 RepID=UPI001880237E|nr:hypothetical protein [Pedobacter sp. MC2016-24]MBE9598679.1 hypothetical protein [Pedobacter sp. MC2016-24]